MTSKEVFALRKSGNLDEAYEMARQLMEAPDPGAWDIKAFGWCLINLIKRDSKAGQQQHLEHYRQQLEALNVNPDDDILTQQREYALKLCNPSGQAMQRAKMFSQKGQHQEAVRIYFQLFEDGDHSDAVQASLGWELYRLAKQVVGQDPPNFGMAHQCLHDYFRLRLERPSNLHTCILRVADKMAKANNMQMGDFVRAWGLENLTAEDFERFIGNDGKSYPALAERVVQRASKDASDRNAVADLNYIEPYLNDFIERFPDNLWLKYYKAKVLIALERSDEAVPFGLEVVKNKSNEFWSWGLLGDIHQDISTDLRLACYSKALLCSTDINFVGNVKLKLAEILIDRAVYGKAKREIDEVINFRRKNDQKIPPVAAMMMGKEWYAAMTASSSNRNFYLEHAKAAEELLYSGLSWINAVLGDSFTPSQKPGEPKRKLLRKLYIEARDMPFEIVIAESKISMLKPLVGAGVKVKGEFDRRQRFHLYKVQERSGAIPWDIFEEQIGVVDHINTQKKLLHFILDREQGSIVHFSDLQDEFRVGDAIAVRVSSPTGKSGKKQRVFTARKKAESVPLSLLRPFDEHVRIRNGMGFTDHGVFIPPPMVDEHRIADDCMVTGMAILNYNKKRFEWGWKAIFIKNVDFFSDKLKQEHPDCLDEAQLNVLQVDNSCKMLPDSLDKVSSDGWVERFLEWAEKNDCCGECLYLEDLHKHPNSGWSPSFIKTFDDEIKCGHDISRASNSGKGYRFDIGISREKQDLINTTVLSLADKNLSKLPKEISNLKQLKYLDLSRNKFSVVPIEICSLENLTVLWCENLNLTSLPKEIINLKKIEEISLEGNDGLFLTKEQKAWICTQRISVWPLEIEFEIAGGVSVGSAHKKSLHRILSSTSVQ